MTGAVPGWALALDYVLGVVMWTLIARFALGLFLPPGSKWFFARVFERATDPVLRVFRPVTPGFLVAPLVPLYVAWFFFMARFYALPPLMGYGVMGVLSFPLEGALARMLHGWSG